jgi:hypothetical protein
MEEIMSAAVVTAAKLVQLIFLGFKTDKLTAADIEKEIARIQERETELISRWRRIIR